MVHFADHFKTIQHVNKNLIAFQGASRCSEGPLFRRFIVPKVRCSEGPLFRRFIVPKVRCSEGSLIQRFVGPNSKPIRVLHACLLSILHFERLTQNKHLRFKPSVTLHRQVKRIEPAHVSFYRAHIDMYLKSSDF